MTVPPRDGDPRRWFAALRTLRDAVGLAELSMGMTDDYTVAVEEGATIVRVGRAIFGARPEPEATKGPDVVAAPEDPGIG